MPSCVNCGEEISELQYNNFYQLCPACVRIKQLYELSRKGLDLNILKEQIRDDIKKVESIYILRLENRKWWIGKTKNVRRKINSIKRGSGSKWIKENRFISVEKIIQNGDLTSITLDYIKKYGYENVRGTCWYDGPQIYIPKKIRELVAEQKMEEMIEVENINDTINGNNFPVDTIMENKSILNNEEINYLVYILKLENDKWYVGKTTNLKKALQRHKKGLGPPWTTIHKLLKVEEVLENRDLKEVTLNHMRKYGWQNVRGYAWSQWNMKYPPKELRNSNSRESKTFIQGHRVKINKQGYKGEIGKIVGYDGFKYYEIELLKIKKTIKCLEDEIERASQNDIKKHEISLQIDDNLSLKLKDQNLKPLIECLDRNPNFEGLYSLGKYYSLHNYPDIHKSDFLSQKIIQLKSLNEEAAKKITEIFLKFINSSSVLNSIIDKIDYGIMMPTTKNVNHVSLWGKNIFNKLNIKDLTELVYIKPEKAKYFSNYAYKNPHDRELTAKEAFMLNKSSPNFPELNNKKCLILDDVCTTGNQINGLTNLLVSEGVKEVYAFVIGRTKY